MQNAHLTPLAVGMVGHGFMGAAHSHAWRSAHRFFDLSLVPELRVLAGRDERTTAESAARYGFAAWTTRWQDLVEDPRIDLVDICSPGDTHREIALAALAAGKHVLCEKPLANSVPESEEMAAAAARARAAGARSMCGFSYRRTPALAYARQLVAEGALGEIRQVRAQYLQDWLSDADAPMTWRLQKERAGSGALGDIGAHIIDLAQWITGLGIEAVSGTLRTVVPTRPVAGAMQGLGGHGDAGGAREQVTVDDVALFTARLDGGVLGSFEATRMALGRRNAMRLELNGTRGSLAFDFERMNELELYDGTTRAGRHGFTRILATEPEHPYADAWWPTGHGLGYEHTFTHEIVDLVRAIGEGTDPSPSFEEALQVQRVLTAVERSAAEGSRWCATAAPPTSDPATTDAAPAGGTPPMTTPETPTRTALVVRGGWDGHQPAEATDLFLPFLRDNGFEVRIEDSPAVYADAEYMATVDLIVQCVTMSTIERPAFEGLRAAIEAGTGMVGWHGGIADSYRNESDYLTLIGGQFGCHPGRHPDERTGEQSDNYVPYTVTMLPEAAEHPITRGIEDFDLVTEQYWVLSDDYIDVLATTTQKVRAWDPWHRPVTSPAIWTRQWGEGRIVVCTPGHHVDVLEHPSVRTIIERGMLWAAR